MRGLNFGTVSPNISSNDKLDSTDVQDVRDVQDIQDTAVRVFRPVQKLTHTNVGFLTILSPYSIYSN